MKTDLPAHLHLIASGKVREIYELDELTVLFVTTDRISGTLPLIYYGAVLTILIAYDVVMKNVRSQPQPITFPIEYKKYYSRGIFISFE